MTKRSIIWQRLSEFFERGGIISNPLDDADPLLAYRPPVEATPRRLIEYGGAAGGGKTAEVEAWLERVNDALMTDRPLQAGMDLANGRSETWMLAYDWQAGKLVYRKIDPSDMARE